MTASFSALPVGPFEHVSMDYARLREEALRHLERLGSAQWTDYNAHDPGITILEQLCYAITDLGYRAAFPVPDLLAGAWPWLPGPEAILTTDPVTSADLRKAALDVEGIGNAWVEKPEGPEVSFYHHAASRELRLRADPADPDAEPVRLEGLRRIVLQTTDQIQGEAALARVAARLHAARGLGSDFQVSLLGPFPVGMNATIEVGAANDPVELMAEIVERIEAYLAPRAHFVSRAEALAQGRPIEEVLDGPLLDHGFVDLLPAPRRTVYVSDLLHVILDVPAVKAVRSLILQGASKERWALQVPPGQVAVLAPSAQITLVRNDLPLTVDLKAVRQRVADRRAARAQEKAAGGGAGLPQAPAPRPRDLTRHRSIQYQLPAAYGVGPYGLPGSASAERRAQARQLAAYLLIFDQLFANALAQLAGASELLSPQEGKDRTYFALPVEDARLGLQELIAQNPAEHRKWLDKQVEVGDPLERRKRFLAHLLARFAEELGDHTMLGITGASAVDARERNQRLVQNRRAFLRDYPRLSGARGSGYDIGRHGQEGSGSGFEERLRHKLGLLEGNPYLHVVEHLLLRPLPEDMAQLAEEGQPEVPLLAGVEGPDPWSQHVSIVLAERPSADPAFEQFAQQTILAETPAHLSVRLHWFGKADGVDDWKAFDDAWSEFRAAYRDHRAPRLPGVTFPADLPLRVRDARDRVIDLLGFGRTYPLRDLPVPEEIFVTPGARAKIPVGFSQKGVSYQLCNRVSGAPVPGTAAVDGTGGPIELLSPPIDVDVSYRIRALKKEGAQTPELRRETWLRTVVSVVEGVDPSLVGEIQLPLLDKRIDPPVPSAARLGDYSVKAEVKLFASQEGVSYELIENAANLDDPTKHRVVSEKVVVGTSGDIVLRTVTILEDVDLRIRGQKKTGDPANPVIRIGVLDAVLPLRVRANTAAPVTLTPPVVEYGGAAVLKIANSQASAEYTVYRGRVRDRDYVFRPKPGMATIDVPGDDRTVQLARPPRPAAWADLPGFTPMGTPVRGNGSAVQRNVDAAGMSGAFLLVKAVKQHQSGPLGTGSEEIPSAVQLAGAFALLVRPNPAQLLKLSVTMAGAATNGSLLVDGGEPGVFYELRKDGATEPVGRPAYFHQRDDENAQINKGIDQLRVEVDLAVPRTAAVTGGGGTPAERPPALPLLDTAPLPADTVLRVQARRAMSGLLAPLSRTAVLAAMPAVSVQPATILPGASADVVLATSRTDERYWLARDGQRVGNEVAGTGASIKLPTGALSATTELQVVAVRQGDANLPVERSVVVKVTVTQP